MLNSGDFLSGIYNYCDRWCERCRFNSRCLNYQSELSLNEKYSDDSLEGTLQKVGMIFEQISEMLNKIANEEGIDISGIQDIRKKEDRRFEKILELPLIKKANLYFKMAHEWFKENGDLISNKLAELKTEAELGLISDRDPVDQILRLNDVIEIIMHYHAFINVKLSRAYSDRTEEIFDREFADEDMNLSVKLALIGIDNSIMGWLVMTEVLGDLNSIKTILRELENLLIEAEREFPEARDFKRPYFEKEGPD